LRWRRILPFEKNWAQRLVHSLCAVSNPVSLHVLRSTVLSAPMISAKDIVYNIARKLIPMPLRNVLRPYWQRQLRARDIAKVGPAQRWSVVQNEEIDFWDRVLDVRNVDLFPETRPIRTNPEMPLQEYLTNLIDVPPGSCVEILDVGAGPLTVLGKKWPGRDVRITAVDANAVEYDRLLAKHGIEPFCRTKLGYAEDLSSAVPLSTFDLVHARNCIDHSQDPLKAIGEMVRAVKPGCCVFLNHAISEGRRQKYTGPHQWNFFPRQSRFYIERPGMRAIDVGGETLKGIADVTIGSSPDGPEWFSATIRRRC
jgi:SAM-dependent methyltransferase